MRKLVFGISDQVLQNTWLYGHTRVYTPQNHLRARHLILEIFLMSNKLFYYDFIIYNKCSMGTLTNKP